MSRAPILCPRSDSPPRDRPAGYGALAFALAGLAASCLCAGPAAADDDLSLELPLVGRTTFSLTNTTMLRWRGRDYDGNPHDDDFVSLFERLDLALQADGLRAEARVDAFIPHTVFVASPCAIEGDGRCYLAWDVRPERLALRWEPERWTLEAGDSQIVFGRGIALSFRKVDLLGVDNALRGGHVRYRGEAVQLGVHAGVANPQNQDPLDLSIIDEDEDVVVGTNLRVTAPGGTPVHLGAHAVTVLFEDDRGETPRVNRAVNVGGWSVEAPALADGQLALYLEANALRRTFDLFDEHHVQGGRAVYASAQIQLPELTLLIEWKDYANFLVAPDANEAHPWEIYNAAPPVEYDGPQRLRGIGNQRGGGVRADYALLPGPWSLSLNSVAYGFHEDPLADAWDGHFVSHSWARLARRQEYGDELTWSLDLSFGARFEVLLHDLPEGQFSAGDLDRWMIHGRAELTLASGEHSFDIVVDHRHEHEIRGDQRADFQVGGASVTYSFGVPLTLTVAMRWSDFQPGLVERREREVDYNFLGGALYPSVEARVTFEPGTYLGLYVGQTPGGQLCSGGVCRDVPPFEGVRLSFVGRL